MNKKPENRRTIRKDLLILLLLSIMVPALSITAIYTYSVKKVIDTDVRAYQEVIIGQAKLRIEHIFSSIETIQRSVIGRIMTKRLPSGLEKKLDREEVLVLRDVMQFLHTLAQSNTYINGIYLLYGADNVISSRLSMNSALLLEKPWITIGRASEGEELIFGPHPADYNVGLPRDTYDSVVTSIKKFVLPGSWNREVVLQVDVNFSAFEDFIESMEADEQIPMYIYNTLSESILLENEVFSAMSEKQRGAAELYESEIRRDHLYLYGLISQEQVAHKFYSAILGMIVVITLISIFAFISALMFSRRITSPLHELYLSLKQVEQGDFKLKYPETDYKELGYLIDRFRKMVSSVDHLIETIVHKEKETSEAKLQALQAKINPHFLYNTLDVIRSIALEYDNHDISEMTLSLSRLFRYNVGNLKEFTNLDDELEYIFDYLKIQEYRFGNRIHVEFDIPEEVKSVEITRFVLQPIVENAFKYGLELRGRGGLLKISAEKKLDSLYIRIYDNGPGIEAERLRSIQESFDRETGINEMKRAHGLDNVNLRLKLLYGAQYGLFLESDYTKWTEVSVKVPFQLEQ